VLFLIFAEEESRPNSS